MSRTLTSDVRPAFNHWDRSRMKRTSIHAQSGSASSHVEAINGTAVTGIRYWPKAALIVIISHVSGLRNTSEGSRSVPVSILSKCLKYNPDCRDVTGLIIYGEPLSMWSQGRITNCQL